MGNSPSDSKNILLVERRDNKSVVLALLKHHSVPETFALKEKEGFLNLIDTLEVQLIASGIERLGIIVDSGFDAEPMTDLSKRWVAIINVLASVGYPALPTSPEPDGTIIRAHRTLPRVGIWLMPTNDTDGTIEDFVSLLVPDGDELWEYAETCVDGIPPPMRFNENDAVKAQVHTWLSWQKEPGRPFGLAITSHYLSPDAADAMLCSQLIHRIAAAR